MKLGNDDRTGRVRVGGRGGALEANACSVPPVLCRTEEAAFEKSGMVVRSIPNSKLPPCDPCSPVAFHVVIKRRRRRWWTTNVNDHS